MKIMNVIMIMIETTAVKIAFACIDNPVKTSYSDLHVTENKQHRIECSGNFDKSLITKTPDSGSITGAATGKTHSRSWISILNILPINGIQTKPKKCWQSKG